MSIRSDKPDSDSGDLQGMLEELIMQLAGTRDDLPSEDTPAGRLAREFFADTWRQCRNGLLKRTNRIRLHPEVSPAPHRFRFAIDCNYKRKHGPDAEVETVNGTVSGEILYRADLFEAVDADGPSIGVLIDRDLGYWHPNYCQHRGVLCIGDQTQLAPVLPLSDFVELHLFPIISYQNRKPMHALDPTAARYFALDPQAMEGLEPVAPLY